MTEPRHTASTINDQALDDLYAQRDRARNALRHLMRHLPNHNETSEEHVDRTPPAAVRQLVDAIADTLPDWDPAEARDFVWGHYQLAHRVLTRRVERAENAVARVRVFAADAKRRYAHGRNDYEIGKHDLATTILGTLDDTEQAKPQPPAERITGTGTPPTRHIHVTITNPDPYTANRAALSLVDWINAEFPGLHVTTDAHETGTGQPT
ncbi:hypothetical protein [Streptomyces sp. NPDC056188]|uniref:hypothetical protein n=1 Tax=Streptomyces sp. NPDC056188 TaxID=3345740 RepID=UPI0035E2C580